MDGLASRWLDDRSMAVESAKLIIGQESVFNVDNFFYQIRVLYRIEKQIGVYKALELLESSGS